MLLRNLTLSPLHVWNVRSSQATLVGHISELTVTLLFSKVLVMYTTPCSGMQKCTGIQHGITSMFFKESLRTCRETTVPTNVPFNVLGPAMWPQSKPQNDSGVVCSLVF